MSISQPLGRTAEIMRSSARARSTGPVIASAKSPVRHGSGNGHLSGGIVVERTIHKAFKRKLPAIREVFG